MKRNGTIDGAGGKLTAHDIVQAIRELGRQLGRAPTRAEFTRMSGISHFRVQAHFPSLREAVRQAGLEPNPQGRRVATADLLRDWSAVARKLGCVPSRSQYLRHGRYSGGVFTLRFGSWTAVPASFVRFARENDVAEEWYDVVQFIDDAGVVNPGLVSDAEAMNNSRRRDATLPRLTVGNMEIAGHDDTRNDFSGSVLDLDSTRRRGGAASLPQQANIGLARGPASLRPGSSNHQMDDVAAPLSAAPLPAPLAGQRCVTHLVAALIVNTLMPRPAEDWRDATPAPESSIAHAHGHDAGPWPAHLPDYPLARLPILSRPLLRDRPVLGAPLLLPGLAYAPVNEAGVVFLFGMLAHRLGFRVECLQPGFPDCEAVRETAPGRWQRVRIEFEYESRNFQNHRHPPSECDLIVCWRHNWPDCPLEVVELRKAIAGS